MHLPQRRGGHALTPATPADGRHRGGTATVAADPDTTAAVRLARAVLGTAAPVLAPGPPDRGSRTLADPVPPDWDAGAIGAVAHALLHPVLRTLADRRILITLHLPSVPFALGGAGGPARAWWPDAGALQVVNPADAYVHLVDRTIAALAGPVRTVARRGDRPEREVWAAVAAVFTGLGPRHTMAAPDAARRECELVARAARGTVLGHRPRYVEFRHDDAPRCLVQRPACCRPAARTAPDRTGADPWSRRCVGCPLLTPAQAVRIARADLTSLEARGGGP